MGRQPPISGGVKPKPLVTSCFIVAALDGPDPRFLGRDSLHRHWVVATDHRKATPFATQAEAIAAADDWRRLGYGRHHTRPGDWRAYAMSTKLTFAEATAAAA